MRNIFLIIFSMILSANSCSQDCNKQCEAEKKVRKLITGKWVLTTDKKFIMEIKNDTIIYYYNKKVDNKFPFILSFGDSLWLYEEKENDFHFDPSKEVLKIKEYDAVFKDTITSIIEYLDKDVMELFREIRHASFRKLN